MIGGKMPKETVWTVEVGDILTIKCDGNFVPMVSVKDLSLVGLELGVKLKKTIEAMPKYGAKKLKMVISWE